MVLKSCTGWAPKRKTTPRAMASRKVNSPREKARAGLRYRSPSSTRAPMPPRPAKVNSAQPPPRQAVRAPWTTTINENSAPQPKASFSPSQPSFSPMAIHLPFVYNPWGWRHSSPGKFRSTVKATPAAATHTSSACIHRRFHRGRRPPR